MMEFKPCKVILEPLTPKQMGLSAELKNALNERNLLTTRTKKKLLLDLDEINETYMESDRKSHRAQAVKEILTSEVSYLNQLQIVKDYFMKPIKERGILTTDEFQTLFGSIQTIYNVNNELLRQLQKDPENIADTFSKIAPFFKLYSVYAYNYKKSLCILQNAQTTNLRFLKFLEQQESRPEIQKKLSALLITPIQRVPRYRLLLQQVLTHTSPKHSSYSLIIDSLNKVEQAATHINALVEVQENTQRLLELQRSLQDNYPSIIKPDRKLIKEGFLFIMAAKGNNTYKRYFVLMSDILMCCKMKKEHPNLANSLKCSCMFPLNKCTVTEMLSKGAFRITCLSETMVLFHEHARESEEWVKILTSTIKKCVNNRCTLRKDSSSRRPVYKKQLSEYQEVGVSPGRPRKKRQLEEKDHTFNNTLRDSEESNRATSGCFPIIAIRRRPIRYCGTYIPCKIPKLEDTVPSISLSTSPTQLASTVEVIDQQVATENNANDVFVFGSSNQPQRGFFFNMLTGLGNSVRRMFGFKD